MLSVDLAFAGVALSFLALIFLEALKDEGKSRFTAVGNRYILPLTQAFVDLLTKISI